MSSLGFQLSSNRLLLFPFLEPKESSAAVDDPIDPESGLCKFGLSEFTFFQESFFREEEFGITTKSSSSSVNPLSGTAFGLLVGIGARF